MRPEDRLRWTPARAFATSRTTTRSPGHGHASQTPMAEHGHAPARRRGRGPRTHITQRNRMGPLYDRHPCPARLSIRRSGRAVNSPVRSCPIPFARSDHRHPFPAAQFPTFQHKAQPSAPRGLPSARPRDITATPPRQETPLRRSLPLRARLPTPTAHLARTSRDPPRRPRPHKA
jgi:hypothetical protein